MPLNPTLIPTLTVDVNGRTTTVHKLPQGSTDRMMSIPAPGSPVSNKSQMMRESRVNKLAQHVADLTGDDDDISGQISRYSDGFLDRIEELFDSESDLATPVAGQIVGRENERFISECIHFYPKMDHEDYGEASSYVRSLRLYPELRHASSLTRGEQEHQSLALMEATRIIHEKTPPSFFADPSHPLEYRSTDSDWDLKIIKQARLVNFIVRNPDRAEAIGKVVARYGFTEPASILAVMGGTIPALADGAL
jgi:hypothetical protein